MTPFQLSTFLHHIASKIESSSKPNKELVVRDLKNILAAINHDPSKPYRMSDHGALVAQFATLAELIEYLKINGVDDAGLQIYNYDHADDSGDGLTDEEKYEIQDAVGQPFFGI